MKNSMSRILIETTVRQTLKSLKENPGRSVRNLVDMALQFSKGAFQNSFFETAHIMLKNENSVYYQLIQDATNHIETEHLVRLGMNIGYNSCTWGAQRIRMNEKQFGFNIPWAVLLQLGEKQYLNHFHRYRQIIKEGEKLGIYSWMLFVRNVTLNVLTLAEAFPDSAFFLFCNSEDVTPTLVDEFSNLNNLMPVICFNEGVDDACTMLRKAELPYSVFYLYSGQDIEAITGGDLFYDTQQLHPLFTVLIPKSDCQADLQKRVQESVIKTRKNQQFQTLPWELYGDTRNLDEIISDDACCAFFDENGNLHVPGVQKDITYGNLFEEELTNIFKRTYPKDTVPKK